MEAVPVIVEMLLTGDVTVIVIITAALMEHVLVILILLNYGLYKNRY